MTHANSDLRTAAVEGFAKLFLADVMSNPKILTKLLIVFFDTTFDKDHRLKQCLSIFFQAYATKHKV
jgi:condensin complex subunit 3